MYAHSKALLNFPAFMLIIFYLKRAFLTVFLNADGPFVGEGVVVVRHNLKVHFHKQEDVRSRK